MSTGALTQLAAVGSQDQYLSVQGEVTFWKGVYRRHTNFAQEAVTMQFNQTPAWGQKCTAVISRTGDLLSKTWLVVKLPAINPPVDLNTWVADGHPASTFEATNSGAYPGARFCDEVGHALIEKVDLIIGGTTIDSHPGHYLQVWNELTQTDEKKQIAHLVGRSGSEAELEELAQAEQTLYVPLQFFFCRHLMQALPLIALQYHEVKIEVKFKKLVDVVAKMGVHSTNGARTSMQESNFKLEAELLCNLVYLEEEERKTFAGSTHEYLVDLLQFQGEIEATGSQTTYHAFFNHPTSELIWVFVPNASIEGKEPFNYSALDEAYNAAGDTLVDAKLQFNGYDRFQAMKAEYFRELQPAQYHTSVPTRPIYVYSFALEPEDFRPSGSVNLSRIDNVKLVTNHVNFGNERKAADGTTVLGNGLIHPNVPDIPVKGAKLRVYARSKNVLRIKSGMGGLAYAN